MLDLLRSEEDALKAERKNAKDELDGLQEQERQSDVAGQKRSIEKEIEYKSRDRDVVVGRLKARFASASRAISLLSNRDALKPLKLGEVTFALDEVQRTSLGLAPPGWPRDPQTMEDLLSKGWRGRFSPPIRWRSLYLRLSQRMDPSVLRQPVARCSPSLDRQDTAEFGGPRSHPEYGLRHARQPEVPTQCK